MSEEVILFLDLGFPLGGDLPGNPIADMIAAGEAGMRAWQPAAGSAGRVGA